MKSYLTHFIFALLILIISVHDKALSQDSLPEYSIFSVDSGGDNQHRVSVIDDTIAEITIESHRPIPDSVSIQLSPFKNKDNVVRYFTLSDENDSFNDSVFVMDDHFIRLRIDIGQMDVNEEYFGNLLISRPDKKVATLPIAIRRIGRYRPAAIKLDRSEININTTRSEESFTLLLYEASGNYPIKGLHAWVQEDNSDAHFDIMSDITVLDETRDTLKFWNANTSDTRFYVSEGGNYLVNVHLKNLKVGQRTLKLAFNAANVSHASLPTVTINVTRKHHIIWVIICIVVAIAFSFITKKMVAIRESRNIIRKRAQNIGSTLSDRIPYNSAKIRVKRILIMATAISRKSFSRFDSCQKDLDTAETIARFLQRTSEVYFKIQALPEGMKQRRALKCYGRVLNALATLTFNEENKTEMDEQIKEMEGWFASHETLDAKYAEDLDRDVNLFMEYFDKDLIKENIPIMDTLIKEANQTKAPVKREEAYAILKVLWEKRNDEKRSDIIDLVKEKPDVEEVLKKTDEINWERLQEVARKESSDGEDSEDEKDKKIRFISPVNSGSPVESFQSIYFEVAPDDREIGNNYLFKHGLRYIWHIKIITNKLKWWHFWEAIKRKFNLGEKVIDLHTISDKPTIRQFSPIAGTIKSSVTMHYKDEQVKICVPDKDALKVKQSTSTRITQSTKVNDWISIIAAGIIAIITGITSYYMNVEVFGTLKDYILLFLWGAGIEQGTTFLGYLNKDN